MRPALGAGCRRHEGGCREPVFAEVVMVFGRGKAQFLLLSAFVCLAFQSLRAQDQATDGRVGLPQDWSTRHVIFTNGATPEVAAATARDPRSWINWVLRTFPRGAAWASVPDSDSGEAIRPKSTKQFANQTDWAVSLGPTGGMPVAELRQNICSTPTVRQAA